MSMQKQETTQSWSGLGVGTDRRSFLDAVTAQLPEFEAERAAEAVFCGLSELLSEGLMRQLREQLPEDLRGLLSDGCARHAVGARGKVDRDDFYLQVANHLNAEPEGVRRVLHGVFAALQAQVTEAEARKVESQLPRWLQGTWSAARLGIDRPS